MYTCFNSLHYTERNISSSFTLTVQLINTVWTGRNTNGIHFWLQPKQQSLWEFFMLLQRCCGLTCCVHTVHAQGLSCHYCCVNSCMITVCVYSFPMTAFKRASCRAIAFVLRADAAAVALLYLGFLCGGVGPSGSFWHKSKSDFLYIFACNVNYLCLRGASVLWHYSSFSCSYRLVKIRFIISKCVFAVKKDAALSLGPDWIQHICSYFNQCSCLHNLGVDVHYCILYTHLSSFLKKCGSTVIVHWALTTSKARVTYTLCCAWTPPVEILYRLSTEAAAVALCCLCMWRPGVWYIADLINHFLVFPIKPCAHTATACLCKIHLSYTVTV